MDLGSFITSPWSAVAGGAADMAFNAWQAERSQDFTQKMMTNKYQWLVQDLRKAGLNPMLAVSGGATANVGGSAEATSGGAAGGIAERLLQQRSVNSAVALNQALSDKAAADAAKARGDTLSPGVADEVARAAAGHSVASAGEASQNVENLKAGMAEIRARVDELKASAAEKQASADTLNAVRALEVRLRGLEAGIKQYVIPQERAKAKGAETVEKGLDTTGSVTETIGHKLGQQAADLRDYLEEYYKNLLTEFAKRGRKK